MLSKAAKEPELSHGSVCKGGVLEHSFDLLDGNCIIDVLVLACLDDNRRGSITNYKGKAI